MMVRHNLSPMKSFLFEEEGILGQKEEKWKGESQCSGLSRKETESVGKNVEGETKGLGYFKSGVSAGVYFRVLRNQIKKSLSH